MKVYNCPNCKKRMKRLKCLDVASKHRPLIYACPACFDRLWVPDGSQVTPIGISEVKSQPDKLIRLKIVEDKE